MSLDTGDVPCGRRAGRCGTASTSCAPSPTGFAPNPASRAPRWVHLLDGAVERVLDAYVGLDPANDGGVRRRGSTGRSLWIEPVAPHLTSTVVLAQEGAIRTWVLDRHTDLPELSSTVNCSVGWTCSKVTRRRGGRTGSVGGGRPGRDRQDHHVDRGRDRSRRSRPGRARSRPTAKAARGSGKIPMRSTAAGTGHRSRLAE